MIYIYIYISVNDHQLCRTMANDAMWIYQHSTQCLSAIQLFLDCHPEYWCLIPMKSEEAIGENNIPTLTTLLLPLNRTIKNHDISTFIDGIPKPSPGYTFSRRQFAEQFHLLLHMLDPMIKFNINVDLYNMAIIAVRKSYFNVLL
jgi:hypothetical protein